MTARGPLFAEAKVRYEFDTGYWTFTARVVRGSPLVLIEEELDNGWNDQKADERGSVLLADAQRRGVPADAGILPGPRGQAGVQDAAGHGLAAGGGRGGAPARRGRHLANGYTLRFAENRTDYHLIGWPCWSPRVGVGVRFVEPGSDAVGLRRRAHARVAEPDGRAIPRDRQGRAGGLPAAAGLRAGLADRRLWPNSPNATGKTLGVPATTARRSYGIMLSRAENEVETRSSARCCGPRPRRAPGRWMK